jgi:hypothetical protein
MSTAIGLPVYCTSSVQLRGQSVCRQAASSIISDMHHARALRHAWPLQMPVQQQAQSSSPSCPLHANRLLLCWAQHPHRRNHVLCCLYPLTAAYRPRRSQAPCRVTRCRCPVATVVPGGKGCCSWSNLYQAGVRDKRTSSGVYTATNFCIPRRLASSSCVPDVYRQHGVEI